MAVSRGNLRELSDAWCVFAGGDVGGGRLRPGGKTQTTDGRGNPPGGDSVGGGRLQGPPGGDRFALAGGVGGRSGPRRSPEEQRPGGPLPGGRRARQGAGRPP